MVPIFASVFGSALGSAFGAGFGVVAVVVVFTCAGAVFAFFFCATTVSDNNVSALERMIVFVIFLFAVD
jgi:hypothetical protein